MARPSWYSDHPSACTCARCSGSGRVLALPADRRGGGPPRTGIGTSPGDGEGHGGGGGGNAWKVLAAIVIAALVGVAIYQAVTQTDDSQPTPVSTAPANTVSEPRAAATRPAPSPIPDYEATAEAAIAATVEAVGATSASGTASPTLATPTPTGLPATRTPTPRPTPTATPLRVSQARASLRDFVNGDWLEQEDPRLASAINDLGWMRDGMNVTEAQALQALLYIAVTSRSVVATLASMGWVQDGISADEAAAIDWINNIGGAEVMAAVVALPWVRDGIDDDLEVRMIEELSYTDYEDAGLAMSIVSLDWVRDGLDDLEAQAIDWIGNTRGVEVASALVALPWVRDGIDDELEVTAIEELSYLSHDAEGASRIVGMPFLATIEPPDVSAIASLWQLAANDRRSFEAVMTHAPVRDGISDDLAPIIATLHGVAETNPRLIPVLLHPANVTVERRTVTLPLAGDVVLAIIRTGPGAPRSMDLLERAVRGVEGLMGLPLPTGYVGLLFENAVSGPVAGTNFGTHVAILPEYDVDDGSREAGFTGSHIAHEVAHYYWSGNADWVDEGAADLVASIVDGARTGRPIGVTNRPCAYASMIADLEGLAISQGDDAFQCNYSLGERLFIDLYRAIGHETFLERFRALYLASELEDDDEDTPGTSVGVEHVRQAFRSDDGAETAVIARWYDGTEPYDRSNLDYAPVDPMLPTINGRVEQAFIVTESDGPPAAIFSARDVSDWVLLTLAYSYSVSGTRDVDLEIVEYYEDGFAFSRRTVALTAEPRYIGGIHRFSVGSPPARKWATGRYYAYVYEGDRKVAEVEYEVIP